ncbi:MAG TPA: hypothetical protein VIF09_21120 [Polyangiaceae bacterium]|jgi:hypothetical protein
MVRTIALSAALVATASLVALFAGCGSSDNGGSPADGGSDSSTLNDGTSGDGNGDAAAHDGGGDGGTGLPDGAVPPTGTPLVQSATVVVDGVTSDDFAVYTDTAASTVNVVPVAGGSPTKLGTDDGSGVAVAGKAVLFWSGAGGASGAGAFSVWTSAHGVQALATASPPSQGTPGMADVSSDGAHVLYFDNVVADDAGTQLTADFYVANTDGTGKTRVLGGVHLDNQNCPPYAAFAGAYAVIAYCTTAGPTPDAGAGDAGVAPSATLATYTGASWATTATLSIASQPAFVVDKPGDEILYDTATGLSLASVGTGVSVPLDLTGLTGTFTSDGKNVVWVASDGSIKRAAVATPATATVLVAAGGGYKGLLGLSPDDKWLLAYKAVGSGGTSDMYLASAETAGAASTLSSATTAAIYGDAFTADSSRVLFYTNIKSGAGDFNAAAVSGGAPTKLGSNAWINASTTGTKALFNDNHVGGQQGAPGTADIEAVDTAATGAPKLMVTQADDLFYLTSARNKVVFSWSQVASSQAGLYATPVP